MWGRGPALCKQNYLKKNMVFFKSSVVPCSGSFIVGVSKPKFFVGTLQHCHLVEGMVEDHQPGPLNLVFL